MDLVLSPDGDWKGLGRTITQLTGKTWPQELLFTLVANFMNIWVYVLCPLSGSPGARQLMRDLTALRAGDRTAHSRPSGQGPRVACSMGPPTAG